MVIKLIKYDLMYYLRKLSPYVIVLWLIGLFRGILWLFTENSKTIGYIYNIFYALSYISVFAFFVLILIAIAKRFFLNNFSNEGYLTLCIPVKSSILVFTKLLSSIALIIAAGISIYIFDLLSTRFTIFTELFKSISYVFSHSLSKYGLGNSIGYTIETLLVALSFVCMLILKLYFCISLGQNAKKHKVASSVGCYFGIFFLKMVAFTILVDILNIDKILTESTQFTSLIVHCELIFLEIIFAIFSVVYFILSAFILKKSVNLE